MAHIAIFCDGTWSSAQTGPATHVSRLSGLCARGGQQRVLYFEGVGTGTGAASTLGRWLSKLGGGLFGWGLNRNIRAAYLALCQSYQPGDKILIFGFSRGAYTARSLAGMIRKCGILADPTPANLRAAFRLYRRRGPRNAPDQPHIRAIRRRLSPAYATSQTDVLAREDGSALVRIAYMGVWDTVGALGIPESLFGRWARWWNRRYSFHDTTLTHLVESARHAVALDERRALYAPSMWDNLDADGPDPGLNRADHGPQRPYQQQWFAGDHGVVGGCARPRALTDLSLAWIWEGAALQGLQMTPGPPLTTRPPYPAIPLGEGAASARIYCMLPWLLRWRAGPVRPADLHDSVRFRLAVLPAYKPRSLLRLMPGLVRLDDARTAR